MGKQIEAMNNEELLSEKEQAKARLSAIEQAIKDKQAQQRLSRSNPSGSAVQIQGDVLLRLGFYCDKNGLTHKDTATMAIDMFLKDHNA